jgi:hypothetical protein
MKKVLLLVVAGFLLKIFLHPFKKAFFVFARVGFKVW